MHPGYLVIVLYIYARWTGLTMGSIFPAVAGMVQDDDLEPNLSEYLDHVLLQALQHSPAGSTQGQAACRFICSRLLHDAVRQYQLQVKEVDPKVVSDLVLHHRQLQDGEVLLVSNEGPFPLDAHKAGKVSYPVCLYACTLFCPAHGTAGHYSPIKSFADCLL